MTFIGSLVGVIYGAFSGLLLTTLLFSGAVVPGYLGPIMVLVSPVANLLPGMPWLVTFLAWYFLNILIFWLLSIPPQISTGFTSPTSALPPLNSIPPTALQLLFRGFGFGTAASINFAIFSPFLAILPIAILAFASIIPILAVIPIVRRSWHFQGIISWMSWVQPVHWFGNLAGALAFLVFRIALLASGTASSIRMDITSGVIESRAPAPVTAFNIAVFTYIGPTLTPGGFLQRNVSSHEVGHAINSAAMTPFYTWGTVIEEFRRFGAPDVRSIGQQTAESRGLPRTGIHYSPIWSA